MTLALSYSAGDALPAADVNSMVSAINSNETDILDLYLNRKFADTAGETIDGTPTPKAVCFAVSSDEELLLDYIGSGAGSYGNVGGYSGAQYGCGMTFTVPAGINKISELKIRLQRPSNTLGNYEIKVRRGNMNSGEILHEETIAVSSLSTSYTTITLALSGDLDVTAGETIYMSARGDGTTSDYGRWEGSNSSFYSGGNRYYNNDASFISTSGDLVFEMSGYFDAGSGVLLADANDEYLLGAVGFVAEDASEDDAVDVQYHGVLDGFSSLTKGKPVFLTDTAGGISHTPGTNPIRLGWAISTTKILIDIERVDIAGDGAISGTTFTVPSDSKIFLCEVSFSHDGSRYMKGMILLIRGSKTTGSIQGAETNGSSSNPDLTATLSGDTITFSGDTTYLSGNVYSYRSL